MTTPTPQDRAPFAIVNFVEYAGPQDLCAALAASEARVKSLLEALDRAALALRDAAADIQGWGDYASEHFQKKHDLAGNVRKVGEQCTAAFAAIDAMLAKGDKP